MEPLVMVAYATRYGSTEETARMVGTVIQAHGVAVDICNVNEFKQWKPYSAVVLVAALYMGRLHRDARKFLASHREELTRVPVALMVPGPVTDEDKDVADAREQLEKELARMPWLHPISQIIVGGKFDPSRLSFPFKWTLRKMPASDARDWNMIRGWARQIAENLQPLPSA